MDAKLPPLENTQSDSHPLLTGADSRSRRQPAGRPAKPSLDPIPLAEGLIRVQRSCFPQLNQWFNELTEPRCLEMCRYSGAHVWWSITGTFLSRGGSRNAFDQQRNCGAAPWNMGQLCDQPAEDPRFDGEPTVTCSDNAAHHAGRVDPDEVREIPVKMIRELLKRRLFDSARLFGRWYVLIVDGTVQEKCRAGFGQDGKTAAGQARYRYVLQVLMLGPDGRVFPFLHESMDLHDPVRDKEDCELKAFLRLSQRLEREFPRLPICWVGDALYSCQAVVDRCEQCGWKYIFTLKEGRQPTLWSELLALLPAGRDNTLCTSLETNGNQSRIDYRWVEDLMLGVGKTNAILAGEITTTAATLYAFTTNFANLTPDRVVTITAVGRQRHRIEDTFNSQKNHGIGLDVFRARRLCEAKADLANGGQVGRQAARPQPFPQGASQPLFGGLARPFIEPLEVTVAA